jgi:hypothetical protein
VSSRSTAEPMFPEAPVTTTLTPSRYPAEGLSKPTWRRCLLLR